MSRSFLHPLFVMPVLLLMALIGFFVVVGQRIEKNDEAIRLVLTDDIPYIVSSVQESIWGLSYELEAYANGKTTSEQRALIAELFLDLKNRVRGLDEFHKTNREESEVYKEQLPLLINLKASIEQTNAQLENADLQPSSAREMSERLISLSKTLAKFNNDIKILHKEDMNALLENIRLEEKRRVALLALIILTGFILTFFLLRKEQNQSRNTEKISATEPSNTLFAAALQSTRVGVLIRNVKQQEQPVVFVNKAFSDITGYTMADTAMMSPGFLAGWQTDLKTLDAFNKAIHQSEPAVFNFLSYRKDGTSFWSEWYISPVVDRHGQTTHYVNFLTDMTQQRQTEEALLAAKEQAEHASAVKSNFLAMMSHEIRTPINGLLGVLNLLNDTTLNNEQKKLLITALTSGQALHEIINDILDYAKIEAGRINIAPEPFSLREMLQEIMDVSRPLVAEKKIELRLQVQDGAPRCLKGDAGRIRQVLLNFMSNAIKFTQKGHIDLKVLHLMTQVRDGFPVSLLRFEVVDTGIGISAGDQERLFREFSQVEHPLTRRFGGTGLGLAISLRLVRLMNGEIGVESKPKEGSKFWFVLPLSVAEESTLPPPQRAEARDSVPLPFPSSKRLLLVEDNETNRMVTCRYLQKAGFDPDLAETGGEAVIKASSAPYDLILMDISMPEMDGLEATRRIRALGGWAAEVPIIALTAHVMPGDRERCLAAGMNGHLRKPVSYETLVQTLKDWLKSPAELIDKEKINRAHTENAAVIMDETVIQTLADDLGVPVMMRITEVFLNDFDRRIADWQPQEGNDDLESIQKKAHPLKSSSANCGLKRFAALMANLETAAQIGDQQRVAMLLKDVDSAYREGRQALIATRARYSS